jgi:diguanylate cyclase (GGDEF)-like protein
VRTDAYRDFRQAAAAIATLLHDRRPGFGWAVQARRGGDWAPVAHAGPLDGAEAYALTLCGPDGAPAARLVARAADGGAGEPDRELAGVQGRLLSSILAGELTADREAARARSALLDAQLDELTGLSNRRGWEAALAAEEPRCRRYGTPASIVALDLDGLKTTNDYDGHAAGDELLCRAGAVLFAAVRDVDVAARVGGDEFAVLLPQTGRAEAVAFARRLEALLLRAGVRASTGVASRQDGVSLHDAAAIADREMLRFKLARRVA